MTSTNTASSPDLSFVITRVMDVPAKFLFLAYTKPEHVAQWFGPPGYPLTMCEMDFRVGGAFRFQMTGPDGVKGPHFGGTYRAIEPHSRIQYDNGFEEEGARVHGADRMIVTVTFTEANGRTTLTLHTLFGSLAMKEHHLAMGYEQGAGAGVTQLEGVARALAEKA